MQNLDMQQMEGRMTLSQLEKEFHAIIQILQSQREDKIKSAELSAPFKQKTIVHCCEYLSIT